MGALADELAKAKRLRIAKDAENVKILTLDIETRPMSGYFWDLWDVNISTTQIIDHGGLMCFAAKWAGKKDIMFFADWIDGYENMVKRAHELLSAADVLVSYNGERFDIKKLNQEFMLNGMAPPKPFKSIDLIRTNKARFALPSRKLDYLAQRSGVGQKVKHQGFELWLQVMAGDPKAQALMEKYNKGDVAITEKTFLRLLPWLTNTPHMAMFTRDDHACPYCGRKDLKWDGEYTHTNVQSYRLIECGNCGGWCRGTTRLQDPTHTRAIR
jgi:hypothetical protein